MPDTPVPATTSAEDALPWLLGRSGDGHVLVLAHDDADGLSAAVVLQRGLLAAGRPCEVRLVGRFQDAWSASVAAEVRAGRPGGLVVADLGVREAPVVTGLPTLLVDHHVPRGLPSAAETCVLSGYGLEPTPSSSVLAWRAVAAVTDPAPLAWVAALGAIGDFGERPAAEHFPDLWRAATANTRPAALRAAVTLINAPRRSSTGDASAALALLSRAARADEVTSGMHPETAALDAARLEVQAEVQRARKVAPVFSGSVALLRVHSRCQVHPLVAQAWVSRLRTQIVLAANSGFRDGFVHFVARSLTGTNLVAWLKERAPQGLGPEDTFAGGHEQASGGALRVSTWLEFTRGLGFADEVTGPPFGRVPPPVG